MFLDDSVFDEDNNAKNIPSKYRQAVVDSKQDQLALKDFDDDDLPAFRSNSNADAPSSSRARMLAQQREIQMKKRQSSMVSGGMIRSSVESNGSVGNSNNSINLKQSVDSQITPAVRQFSNPKSLKDSSQSE